MSQEKKYQVFISSTYTDLIEARSAAINTVLESYNFPVGMELFGADNDEQWTIIKDLIDSSDFYILIIGHRYGSISKEDGISFTEKEFDYAVSKGLKLICFVRNDNVATLPHERDHIIENLDKLKLFRRKVLTNRLCEFWDSVDDLKHKVSHSLYKNMRKHGGTGWVRGNQVSGQLAEEIAKLSEENRKLREENSRLNELAKSKNPLLALILNGSQKMDLIQLKEYQLKDNEYYRRPERKELDIVNNNYWGADSYASSVQKYNDDIDKITEDQIKQHHDSLRVIQKLHNECVNFKLQITNNGNTIANAISIEIDIPDNIAIIDNNSDYDLKYFRNEHRKKLIKDIEFSRLYGLVSSSASSKCKIYDEIYKQLPYLIEMEKDLVVRFLNNGKKILIEKDKLLHSRDCYLDNLYLYPKFSGTGTIKINLICAEFTEPFVYEIPIEVVE